jgi:hypothetical protein
VLPRTETVPGMPIGGGGLLAVEGGAVTRLALAGEFEALLVGEVRGCDSCTDGRMLLKSVNRDPGATEERRLAATFACSRKPHAGNVENEAGES